MDITTPADAERHVAALADELTTPKEGECVLCFTFSMLGTFGCDGSLRWVRRWRDVRWDLLSDLMVRDATGDLDWPPVMPACAGVGIRSSRPCALWEPRRRL